jgi:Dullard-like phosphatase family protein
MNNFNYGPYSQNPYSKYQNNYNNQNLANKNQKDFNYYQMKRNRIYNIYNSNINSINININTINLPNKNNKTPSLQDEILSPNIEDYRPRPPSSNYYDDYNYYSKRNLNYNLRLYQNDPKIRQRERFIESPKPKNYDSYVLNKTKKRIVNIDEHNSINQSKKMLILDLDETLVHSCLKPIQGNGHIIQPDIYLQVKFHSNYHNVYVLKRPFVDEFLEEMSKYYNLIIFTASVQEYADPLLDQLDKKKLIKLRYYRNSCTLDKNGKFVKDLSTLYKDLSNVILLDNNPISYSYNKSNGLPIITWHFDKKDKELKKLIRVLQFLSNVKDVRNYIPRFIEYDMVNYNKFYYLLEEINKENEQNE